MQQHLKKEKSGAAVVYILRKSLFLIDKNAPRGYALWRTREMLQMMSSAGFKNFLKSFICGDTA